MPSLADALDRLRLLATREAQLAAEAAVIDARMVETADVREQAAANGAALAALPAEAEAIAAADRKATDRLALARTTLTEARAALEAASKARRDRDARVAEAEADLRVAEEGVEDAGRHLAAIASRREDLAERERALVAEQAALQARVAALVPEVASMHRVAAPGLSQAPASLDGLDAWGVAARAALFVARGSVAAERERLVAEANAIGSAAIGEDVGALGVAQVIRRLSAVSA